MSEGEYQRRLDSSDPGEWPGEFRAERRRRYLQSTLSECSDPDRWLELHYGPRSPASEIEPKDEPNEDESNEESEEERPEE